MKHNDKSPETDNVRTREEEEELQWLRLLEADKRRWLTMWELNRIAELSNKK